MRTIGRALQVREGEARLVTPMVALSFTASAGFAIGQSGTNALFFERIGTDALPLVYLLQGATAFVVMLGLAGLLGRADRRRTYLAIPAALALVVLAERAALLTDGRWVYTVLWLTAAVAVLAQNVFVWGVAGAITDTRRAKRLFPLFAAGEILGSVAGGLATRPLVAALGAENLLVVWAAALVVAFLLCRVVLSIGVEPITFVTGRARRRRSTPLRDLSASLAYVSRSRLLSWMTVAAVLFSVLFFSLYLPWATAATLRYPNADDLAGFFGLFWAAMTGTAFVMSILATNRLFGRFGVATMVLVLPLLYAGSFAVLLVSSAFTTLVVVRFADGVWLQGVASPAWETLTNVIPETRRDQVRAFLNGGPAQAGTAIAGVIALVGQDALSFRQFAAIGLVVAVFAVFVTWRIRRSYASALVDALRAGRPEVFPASAIAGLPVAFDRDAEALRSALVAAGDVDPAVRRLAVALLADVEDERARSALDTALEDGDATVRTEAVVGLARRPDERGIERILALVDDPDASMSASAAAAVAGRIDDPRPQARLRALVEDGDPAVRATVLQRLRLSPAAVAAPIASGALEDRAPEVRAAALVALARADPERALEPAVRRLEDPSPAVREAASDAIALIGDPAAEAVLGVLARPAAREAALRAVARIDIGEREPAVRSFITQRVADATNDHALSATVALDGEAASLLHDALLERARRNGRDALRAMALLVRDGPAMRAAIDHLDARESGQIANAIETIEATGETSLVRPLIPLWDAGAGRPSDPSIDGMDRILRDDDAFIRSCGELALAARQGGGPMARARTTMPVMERVLFLRKVSLFKGLAPSDLHAIAGVAEEQAFSDGEVLAVEGEMGDELHIVVSGSVRVVRESDGSEIARRGPGEVVGEMSLITRSPRIASLVVDGDVRAIRIGRREFESMIHDRPDIALGVMRVLAQRLTERGAPPETGV